MRRTMSPVLKLILIALVFGGGFLAFMKYKDQIIPKGRQATSSALDPETKAAAKKVPTLRVGVVTWPGYAGGEYFNGGFNASVNSRFYKEYGFLVQFMLMDDFGASREAWKKGEVDLMWSTADAFPVEAGNLTEYKPKIIFQSDWSRGGDAIVVSNGIDAVQDLRGKTIAVAMGTPSHSFLLKTLEADNLKYNDLQVIEVGSAIDAAAQFKAGKVQAAVVWAPDDEDCLANVPGSKILVSTKQAANIIADVFFAKAEFIEANQKMLSQFVEGFLKGAAEINNNSSAREEAIKVLVSGLNISDVVASKTIDRVRLVTYGDNLNFFGMKPGFTGVKGEDLYSQMTRLYSDPLVGQIKGSVPPWRNVIDQSVLRAVNLSATGDQVAEGTAHFAKATIAEASAPAMANKSLSINFATGAYRLDDNARTILQMSVVSTIKQISAVRVRIEGNTDDVGSYQNNIVLSQKRAQAVADYLQSECGCDLNRFVVIGNGSNRPVADNNSDEGRAKNRRTDVQLLQ